MKDKKVISFIGRIAVSIFLLGLLCWLMRSKLGSLFHIIRAVKIPLFFLAFLINMILTVVCSFRLKFLFMVHEIYFSVVETIKLVLIGQFFNNFMPSTVGGDVIKLYYAQKRSQGLIKPFSSIFIDRVLGVTALILFSALSLVFWGSLIKNSMVKVIIWGSFFVLMAFILLFFSQNVAKKFKFLLKPLNLFKIEAKVKELYASVSIFRKSKQLWKAFFLAIVTQFSLSIVGYILALSLSIDLPLYIFLILIPVIGAVSSLPSLNGLGIREGAFVYFFKDFMKPELAFALSILFLSQVVIGSIIGGLVYLFGGNFREREEIHHDK